MIHRAPLRYFKASIICGVLAFLVSVGLFELGIFRGLDAALASFVGQPSPPVIGRVLQYALMLAGSFGIAWTTIDIGRMSLKCAVALVALAECAAAVCVVVLFDGYFSPFAPALAIALASAIALIYSQSAPGRRKQEIYRLLGDRVSAQTFHALLDCDVPLRFEGELREASMVVCEVFNHDALVAALPVSDYVAMTNSFLRNSAEILVQQGGYLDECGECVRGIFGAPLSDAHHAQRACEVALALVDRLDAVNHECQQVWAQTFDYRIAVNSGELVIAARLGTLSVAGEPVEFARRLCAANLVYGSRIAMGSDAFNAAEGTVEVRPLEIVQRSADAAHREEIYELLGLPGLPDMAQQRREFFWKGVIFFRGQRWEEALAHFSSAQELAGSDGPCEFYIRRIEELRAGQPSPGWSSARL